MTAPPEWLDTKAIGYLYQNANPLHDPMPPPPEIRMIPYGGNIPREPGVNYIVMSGEQEGFLCMSIIDNAYLMGFDFADHCDALMGKEYSQYAVCRAQQNVLQACPEYRNNWCFIDGGGMQFLRSPCPRHMICHYCLGLNFMHAMNCCSPR